MLDILKMKLVSCGFLCVMCPVEEQQVPKKVIHLPNFVFYSSSCSDFYFSLQTCIRVATNNHVTESILGCLEISPANVSNHRLFNLASSRFFRQGSKSSHILFQNITRMVSKPLNNILL